MKSSIIAVFFVLALAASAQAANLCVELGCFDYDTSKACQCNKFCYGYENCCDDYESAGCATCEAMGGCLDYDNRHKCQCNSECSTYGNCCSDYEDYCVNGVNTTAIVYTASTTSGGTSTSAATASKAAVAVTSTTTASTTTTTTSSATTTTTTTTTTTATTTTTTTEASAGDNCVGRCGASLDTSKTCQCNTACSTYGDCCADYSTTCPSSSPASLDFDAFASQMWALDVNRIDSSHYTFNMQTTLSSSSNNVDQATGPLFTYFDETTIYNTGTFVQYLKLCDNYEPNQGTTEDRDSVQTEIDEQNEYLDAIMETTLMVKAVEMLTDAGLVTSASDFRSKMVTAFFDLYQRTAADDSSGFEHCFCGEWKSSTQVNGFHNWITFYQLEKQGTLNYYGNFGLTDPDHLGVQFYWEGRKKPLTSIMLGVSTEFELAIYMACFLENPGSQTSFTITDGANSWPIKVQTYQQNTVHVGSAYFIA